LRSYLSQRIPRLIGPIVPEKIPLRRGHHVRAVPQMLEPAISLPGVLGRRAQDRFGSCGRNPVADAPICEQEIGQMRS
jgi:hypothetical protein